MIVRQSWPRLALATLAALLLAACTGATPPPPTPRPTWTPFSGAPRPVIVDTDMAADDWLALLFLLQRQDLAIQAITVTGAGEAHCAAGVRHALDLAALGGRPDIPVACGREQPLRGTHAFPLEWRTRVDGLLGLSLPANPRAPQARSAAALLTTQIEAAPAKTTVLALGPLTNLAEALEASPALAGRIAGIVVMGGALDVPGNVGASGMGIDNASAEWNVYVDPYAANVVLRSGAPVTLVPLDATNQVPVTLDFYNRLAAEQHTPAAAFAYEILSRQQDFIASGGYSFWDPLAAALLSDESLATFDTRRLAVVEAEGPDSGRVQAAADGPLVRAAIAADAARFEELFLATLNAVRP
jgi:pyrimidine-specific ribonucleoside hydrolase